MSEYEKALVSLSEAIEFAEQRVLENESLSLSRPRGYGSGFSDQELGGIRKNFLM
jgi:hypothetical protein